MPLYVGLDVGTQGTKAVVYDLESRRVISRASAQYPLLTDERRPGMAEQSPDEHWIAGVKQAVSRALSKDGLVKDEVCAIGVSGQQHGLVVLDENKEVVRPSKLWCDTESSAEAEELSEKFGWSFGPSFTGSKVLWLKRNEPEHWERTRHILMPKDYVNLWLTGQIATEASDASGTAYFDPLKRDWDARAMDVIGIPREYLPPLLDPHQSVGRVRSEIASLFGIPSGTLVSPGGGDNAMSALACSAVKDGTCVMSLGTSGTLFSSSSRAVLDGTGTICPFCDCTGAYLPLICTLNCAEVPEDVRAQWGDISVEEITAMAAAEPAGCGGVTYLPYLRGERTPNWPQSYGALLGLRKGALRPGLVYRAALEGVTFALLAGVAAMRSLGVSRLEEVILVGGGAKNPLWQRIIADAFRVGVTLIEEEETAALGGALQAAAVHSSERDVASFVSSNAPAKGRTIRPNPKESEAYEAAFQRHQSLGKVIFG